VSRHLPYIVLSGLLMAATVFAEPKTPPAGLVEVPVPQAESATAAEPVQGMTLVVLPFAETGPSRYPWVSRAIQQDMVAELGRTTRARIGESDRPALSDSAAIDAARRAGASAVVQGQYQAVGNEMRISGQVLSVTSGKAMGSFSANGPVRELFPLEDQVTGQVLRALPAAWVTVSFAPPPQPAAQNAAEPAAPAAPPADATSSGEYYSVTHADYAPRSNVVYNYGSAYPYPYYYYGYPYYYYYPGVVFSFGGGHYYHHYGHGYGHVYHRGGPSHFGGAAHGGGHGR